MNYKVLFVSLALLLTGGADEAGADEAGTEKAPISVIEPAKIEAQLGKTVTIRGQVTRTGQSKGGLQFLNFANAQFVVVCFPDAVAKFTSGQPVDLYKQKTIDVTGEIVKYRDKFQIKLESPNQIKVVKVEAAAGTTSEPEESKAPKKPAKLKTKQGATDKNKKPVDPKKFFDC